MNILLESDTQLDLIRAKSIAVLGYGSQGGAQALNLHDSGCRVTVGLRAGSAHADEAQAAGLAVAEIHAAVAAADVVMMLLPDDAQPAVFAADVAPHLRPGAYLGFAHGYAIHYGTIQPTPAINVFLVAPNGVGALVRRQYEAGQGVPCSVAVQQDPAGDTRAVALAYAAALGCGRAGILETTFREETETDLFAEQAVLCGGLHALITAAYETLVDAGYAPEMAYLACSHEVKLLADLVHERGIAGTRAAISTTARYGDLTRGPRIIDEHVRHALRRVLGEIQSGEFAREWNAEVTAGRQQLGTLEAAAAEHPIEPVGQRLRELMPWLLRS